MRIQRLVVNEYDSALRVGSTIIAICGDSPDPRNLRWDAFNALFDRLRETGGDVSTMQVTEEQREHAERTAVAELANLWDVLVRQIPTPSFEVAIVYAEEDDPDTRQTTKRFGSRAEASAFAEGVVEGYGRMEAEQVKFVGVVVERLKGALTTAEAECPASTPRASAPGL